MDTKNNVNSELTPLKSTIEIPMWKKMMIANFEGFKIGFALYIVIIATMMFKNKGILDDSRPLLLIFQTYIFTYMIQARKETYDKRNGGKGDRRLLNYLFFQPLLPSLITFFMYAFMRVFSFDNIEQSNVIFVYFLAVTGAVIFYVSYSMYWVCKMVLQCACCCGFGCSLSCIQNEINECYREFDESKNEGITPTLKHDK